MAVVTPDIIKQVALLARLRLEGEALSPAQFAALEPPARCVAVDVAQRPERCVEQILAQLD